MLSNTLEGMKDGVMSFQGLGRCPELRVGDKAGLWVG